MRRDVKPPRRLGLKKETLRTLNADELLLAAGGSLGTENLANSLSGSRKCVTSTACTVL